MAMTITGKKVALAVAAASAVVLGGVVSNRRQPRPLAGKVVFLTGGSRGFGLALARQLAALQCRIAICARDSDELARAHKSLAAGGREVYSITCDVSDPEAVAAAAESVIAHFGRIDILVNDAGEMMVSPFENLNAEDFERAMAVIFRGTLHTTLAVLPRMKAQGSGIVVNITSIGGKVSVPHLLSYSCAKAATVAFSEGLRSEVRQFGIEVVTVIPGLMRTGSHVNATFKGDQVSEAAWFGAAASFPGLSLDAERAARLVVKAVRMGKKQAVLGVPAHVVLWAEALLPGLTSDVLRLSNSLLPEGGVPQASRTGRELDKRHGLAYRLLTTLGKRAGQRLNQPGS